jgi:rubrerythrin
MFFNTPYSRYEMDIFKFAMEKEKFSEDYYRQLSNKTSNKGLGNILTMLAEEERKHFNLIQQMQQQTTQKQTDTDILGNARHIFEEIRQSAENFSFDITELELYEKARDIEKESRQFYLEKSNEVENASHKKIFKRLADEEQKHLALVQGICDFVARPQWFLENAEMYRFDDYAEGVL